MSYVVQQRKKMILILVLSFFVVGALAIFVVRDTTQFFIEKQAEEVAKIIATFAKTARSVYANVAISKLKNDGYGSHVDSAIHEGYIPIPAQFLKALGQATEQNTANLFHYRPVSRWNIEPSQGLSSDFLKWAWPQLEAQDQENPEGPIDWQPVFRIEQVDGMNVFRYLTADSATSASCVACHNHYETMENIKKFREQAGVPLGKSWKQHQLLGALEITIPLNRIEHVATEQLNRAVLWISIIFLGCLALIGGVYLLNARLHRNLENLSWEANHDPMTDLLNRRAFEREAESLWEETIDSDKEHSLLFLDLDKFKLVNDTYGHHAGDAVLKAVAECLSCERREYDLVARLGGDEFALLLPYCSVDVGMLVAKRILRKIDSIQIDWKGEVLTVGVSIGLAKMDKDSPSVQKVIEQADMASYAAKKSLDTKVVAYSEKNIS
ncbi:diguanylate cyclase/phosphodiesterase (GGDEF & EAL domains) with PAS/PAC sensor(s) [hydrothermal vent metagenome]|uniref:Diguanylate cyclase/phosphodiesterase (GGDEF & EAL domains) with PAS/PAC sensor(S) n=1 Tax=hydrothermal vent metagenome TaxID=652676 RepID=A0A3B0W9D9_9ZZZZ